MKRIYNFENKNIQLLFKTIILQLVMAKQKNISQEIH